MPDGGAATILIDGTVFTEQSPLVLQYWPASIRVSLRVAALDPQHPPHILADTMMPIFNFSNDSPVRTTAVLEDLVLSISLDFFSARCVNIFGNVDAYLRNCSFRTTARAISVNALGELAPRFQIEDCRFAPLGGVSASNDFLYVTVFGFEGDCSVDRCVFDGSVDSLSLQPFYTAVWLQPGFNDEVAPFAGSLALRGNETEPGRPLYSLLEVLVPKQLGAPNKRVFLEQNTAQVGAFATLYNAHFANNLEFLTLFRNAPSFVNIGQLPRPPLLMLSVDANVAGLVTVPPSEFAIYALDNALQTPEDWNALGAFAPAGVAATGEPADPLLVSYLAQYYSPESAPFLVLDALGCAEPFAAPRSRARPQRREQRPATDARAPTKIGGAHIAQPRVRPQFAA